MTKKSNKTLPFRHHLVLNQWLFGLFGFDSLSGQYQIGESEVPTLEAFRDRFQLMGEVVGRSAEGEHFLLQRICENLNDEALLSSEQLLEYDRRIKALTDTINNARLLAAEEPIEWKYFQYLTLLFTEVYLDYLFTKPEELLEGLNRQIERWNEQWVAKEGLKHKPLELLNSNDDLWSQLNMVAYWSATGSGKTLIMHANILQYRFYLQRYGKAGDINKVIILTPNEGLTHQHLKDLEKSGIRASEFSARGGDIFAQDVIVIDINKLRDSEKNKTVAVDSFGSRNLLLVDEGHRGTASGGGSWYEYRQKMCADGFSFEYSATFAQSGSKHENLRQTYTKSILFDYSYRHFYSDGYGKQSQILNLQKNPNAEDEYRYLVASLLSYYQQLRLYDEQRGALAPFNLQRPLWVFVSSKVTANLSTGEASDTVQVLQFVDKVLHNNEQTITAIDYLLNKGMVSQGGVDLLYNRFNYLKELGETSERLYQDILSRVFHSSGGRLHIENITGVSGEIALRAGSSDKPFGVINVGNDSKLIKLCEEHDLYVQDARFSESLFREINHEQSSVNLLLGSKKFTEGWSSWRVSNMTLMNVGRNEGAQIIQLFGRGVRLKGWQTSLKRSAELTTELRASNIDRPKHIGMLETLNIFGVKADYIAQFRKELEDEEIPVNEGLEEFVIPLKAMVNLPQDLNVIRVKESVAGRAIGGSGKAFLELAEQVVLKAPSMLKPSERGYFCNPPRVVLDFYPQVGMFSSDGAGKRNSGRDTSFLNVLHVSLLDTRKLYFELLSFKRDKRWSNLTISQDVVEKLLADNSWYKLYVPEEVMALGSLERLNLWHDMAVSLLRKYCEMFYGLRRRQWESDKLEYRPITENNKYLPGVREETPQGSYLVTLDRVRHDSVITRLDHLRDKIQKDEVELWNGKIEDGLEFLWCERHLYQPLLAAAQGLDFQVAPVALNKGERDLVNDIQQAYQANIFDGYDVYLLRNQTGQGAVGVFIDGGFYPDFILWLVKDEIQKVIFIDPKGLRNHKPEDPKVRFHQTIKEIEAELHQQNSNGRNIELHAFLVAQTHHTILENEWRDADGNAVTKELMESWNILFPEIGDTSYLAKMMKMVS
ncbi:DEAD/DEAH box helicase family protein [Vibrio alginolyticus]|uniref:DEAD/DEAH box helicase family protein n=1 Tax=Vibrio diabolicus TaxID=50719 RepID=UPI002285558B|nr:DEAD/DEAH box helicase family protein [Vibrio diabolicus]EJL6781853.1 DEAD/DEAH box helicase family protein [Vibrio alginolyticus]MCZ0741597.1 DEAD/DEAH box helicase family protein [Vibrio diabolicus]